MPQVALSSDFLEAFARIPRKKQKQVREALEKFKREPNPREGGSLNYERLNAMRDSKVHSVRCGIDYRAIVIEPPKGEVHLFVWVDHHDEAMQWAQNKRFEVNQHTGTLQVYDVEQANASSPLGSAEAARQVASIEADVIPAGRLFSGFDDTTLLLFGVPEPLLVAVRTVYTEGELDRLAPHLPPEAADALYLLAAGYSPEDTIDELDRKKPSPVEKPEFDPDDFDAALKRPGSQQQFKIVDSEHELAEILNAPLERWRIFLHPTQQKLVAMNSGGPARVLGSAGTGKTVVAVHRARYLAEKCPPGKKVLFTTFTTNLAADIQALLESLAPNEMDRIEVTNLHAWARGLLQARGVKVKTTLEQPLSEDAGWLEAYSADKEQAFPQPFYRDEWKEVVQPQGILKEDEYLRARRAGRGTRLSREQRKQVWEVLSGYRRYLQSQGLMDPADLIREAFLLVKEKKAAERYAHVVADEVQDFSEAELNLLRALVPEGPNDLFLVGDAHQRIYGHKASLSRCGINVRGLRSRRLRLNYRTTQSIRNWGVALLRGMSVDDLDEGTDDALKGYHSLRTGSPPQVVLHGTEKAEAKFIVEQVRAWLDAGRAPNTICVAARTKELIRDRYAPLLRDSGIPVHIIKLTESKHGEGVRCATLHRIKGLEFPCVLLASVQAGTVPLELKAYADDTAKKDHLDTERRLLFVAATRARDELVVTGFGSKSPFVTQ